jgi:Asp-tRNA(Asn)/Glu-tRNA(Gln) amidotransferase A subunit family amidase
MAAIPESLPELAEALRSGALSLADYLGHLEARIAEVDPGIATLMPEPGRFERLRREAAALEARYAQAEARPALFGVPVGVKDILHVDGLVTTGGSRLPPEELQGPESAVVTLLKQAGALILGKTVSTEFAYFAPGPTRNPHNPEHTPGGSSSGSAAAVAAGLAPLALGTQTVGSIIRPAAFCGVVGYKPSYERTSRAGVIPLAPSLDHVGTFTSDVAGARLAASVICADWRTDVASRRPVLAVPEGPYLTYASDEGLARFRESIQKMAEAGYTVLHVDAMPDFLEIGARHNLMVAAEAAAVHASWFDRYRDRYHAKTADLVERGRKIAEADLAAARLGRRKLRHELTHLMNLHGIDLWLSPAAPGPAPRGLDSTGDPVMNFPWTHSGLPTVTVPSGLAANGLPLGLQITARWQADELLLAWAAGLATLVAPLTHPAAA